MNKFKLVASVCVVLLSGSAYTMEDGYNHEDAALTDAERADLPRAIGATGYPKIQLMDASEAESTIQNSINTIVFRRYGIYEQDEEALLELAPNGQISLENFRNWVNRLNIDDATKAEYTRSVGHNWWIKIEDDYELIHVKRRMTVRKSDRAIMMDTSSELGYEIFEHLDSSILLEELFARKPFQWRRFYRTGELPEFIIKKVPKWSEVEAVANQLEGNFDVVISTFPKYIHIN